MSAPPSLHLSDAQLEHAGRLLIRFLRDYERAIPAPRVVPDLDRAGLAALLAEPFPAQGIGVEALFGEIADRILPNSTAIAHPRFLAYVMGPPNGFGPFAEALTAALNQNVNIWQLAPAASVIEAKIVGWLGGLFGYDAQAGGIVTSGGSMATQVALSAALRACCGPDFCTRGLQGRTRPLTVYTSTQAHGCVGKAAMMLGLGLDQVRKIPVDAAYRMRLDRLEAAVAADRAAGQQPCCVIATAGTVNTGAIDPIAALAGFCAEQDLWLHVDGAYGALFVLSREHREQLLPCGRADSIALDPHKLLFAPLEAGCLVVKDRATLRAAFGTSSAYITEDDDPLLPNFKDYGPQLSRSFKAFKIWCALRVFGLDTFVAAIGHQLAMAAYLGEQLAASEAFDLMAPVSLSAVCFRLKDGDDEHNRRLLAALTADGSALLGPVSLDGRTGLRACVTNFRTTRADLDLVVARLGELAREA